MLDRNAMFKGDRVYQFMAYEYNQAIEDAIQRLQNSRILMASKDTRRIIKSIRRLKRSKEELKLIP